MRRWMGDAAERIVYGDQYVIVSSVVPAWLIQRVNREGSVAKIMMGRAHPFLVLFSSIDAEQPVD